MTKRHIGLIGISAVGLFAIALLVFGILNPNFHFVNDYVSKLGAVGEPNAIYWNIIGFLMVGLLLMVFGYSYGLMKGDKQTGVLLSTFGLGFALTAIPFDQANETSDLSKAHVVAITLGLAFWLFALAKIAQKPPSPFAKIQANIAAAILVLSMILGTLEIVPMPVTHRLVFMVVFGWTAITSVRLLKRDSL